MDENNNVVVRVGDQEFIRGEDGYSPVVTIEEIEHGHSVNITDREHQAEGQTFDVLDGASAYEQAVAGGYAGTEAEFNTDLAGFSEKAQTAAASATAAAQSAQNAADSATAATTKAQEAAESAATALTRMNSANSSAQAASQSAQDAAASATAASQSEDNAASSATAAAGSATAAAGSASTASTAATTAQGHATNAASSATAASGSATAAASSATAAGNAQTAAETAQAAAEDAQESAETAAQSVSQSAAQISQNASDISDLKSAISEDEKRKANGNIIDKNNLLENATLLYDQYYYGSATASDTYNVYIVSVVSGTEYTYFGIRSLSSESQAIEAVSASAIHTYTATYSGLLYLSVAKSIEQEAFFCTTVNYSAGDYGTIGTPLYASGSLAQTSGQSAKKPASQKFVTDLIDATEETIGEKINGLFPTLPTNITGVSMANGSDLLPLSEVKNNGYYYSSNDALTWSADDNYKAYKIKASSGKYTFSCKSRFTVATDENDNVLLYLSSNSTEITCPSDTAYLYVSFHSSYWDVCKVCKGDYMPKSLAYTWDTLKVNLSELNNKLYGAGYKEVKGSLSNGESLTIHGTNVKKNQVYSFLAYITNFDTLLIGHGKNEYDGSWIEINSSKVILHRYLNADTTTEYTHGLTVDDYIYVQIMIGVNVATIKIFSSGSEYSVQDIPWTGDGEGDTFAESINSTLTNCTFTWACADFRKSIWMFGDSYFGMTNGHRWVKYLIDAGYGDNVMLNAFPGEDSSQAVPSLENAITYYGKPRFIVWCMGMNDGSDANASTPTSKWLNGINVLLGICNEHNIIPILATIPTVPSINHEGKNAYVRNSGYRYIDFAKAVGAQSNGTWFSSMLYEDNVHPDIAGAIALYYQAIADCPEITYSNP